MEQLCNLERRPSHWSNYQQHVESVGVVVAHVDVQQTQPLHHIVWPNVPIMETIEWPLVQRSKPITTTQPIVEATLTCAYYQ